MKKSLVLTCFALLFSFASFATIYGTMGCCTSDSSAVSVDSMGTGGTWSSSNPTIATVGIDFGSYHGIVYGVSPGVVTITYSYTGGAVATATFTVTAAPAPITGPASICLGAVVTYTDATAGGTWSVAGYATITSGGVLTADAGGGIATVYYTMSPTCRATEFIVSAATDAGYVGGPRTICVASTVTKTETVTGGTWSSSNTAIATVNMATGDVTGVAVGPVYIIYSVTGPCGPNSYVDTDFVTSTTPVVSISPGSGSVTQGQSEDMYGSVPYGTWSSSNTTVATIDPSTGILWGLIPGTTTITYTITGCGGTGTATQIVTVNAFAGISGYVNFGSGSIYHNMMVWLITYNTTTHDLEAIDSTLIFATGTSVFYHFATAPTDSYRVKASVSFDSGFTAAGYLPTYHTSAFFWHDADVFYHTSGIGDVYKNIDMGAGIPTAGAGFIGGDVTTGANRGTTDGTPVPNLLVYAMNTTTGAIVRQTYTNASGAYSFTGLPYGAYTIHPELINYSTVPYGGIILSASHTSVATANFIEHTVSHIISPANVAVNNVHGAAAAVAVYPNPASDRLTLTWNETANETAGITITDVTGKLVFKTTVNMTNGAGATQLNLPGLANGLYLLSIRSANIGYNSKLQIQH